MSTRPLTNEHFMKKAIHQAKRAAELGEVPIGCVIVCDGRVIGRGFNRRLSSHSTLAHAEIIAIRQACKKLGDWRLEGCTMYVTLEPCQMCAGALVQSRIDRVIVGAPNPKAGCAGSILNLLQMKEFNHRRVLRASYGLLPRHARPRARSRRLCGQSTRIRSVTPPGLCLARFLLPSLSFASFRGTL